MLNLTPTTRVFVCLGDTDMRKSFDTLASIVCDSMKGDPLSGSLFAFCNRHKNRVKILYFDGSGYWVCAKRLEKGTFAWPKIGAGGTVSMEYSSTQLAMLLMGIDLDHSKQRQWYRRTSATA